MNAQMMVAPSQFLRSIEKAVGVKRQEAIGELLASGKLAVIRRIPELLLPLNEDEKGMVYEWAVKITCQDVDVSNKDFAFHLLVNCQVSTTAILELLIAQGTYSRSTLEHVEQVLSGDRSKFDQYLRQVADGLIKEERIPSRDRARHIYMTLAKTGEEWRTLSKMFTDRFPDLRQRVIERFIRDCADETAAMIFCNAVIDQCLDQIDRAIYGHDVASQMHWVISCAERTGWKGNIREIVSTFITDFGGTLPRSVRSRIPGHAPIKPISF